MSLIQPTIRRFPKTADTLADSNLPFSCVLTPMKNPSSAKAADGGGKRRNSELAHHNYPLLASIPKCMQCGAPHPTKETHFWPSPYSMSADASPSFLLCFLCGGKTTNDQLPPPTAYSGDAPAVDHSAPRIYQLPLLTTPEATYWSLPAKVCPPVCWFLLDGSCTHRSYWNTMAHLLLQILKDIPPHVHVGVLLAATVPSSGSEETATTFSYLDLTSPMPHMLQYVHYEDEEDDEDEEEDDDPTDQLFENGGLLDRMALVPADSLHLPNIHAAIRSLVDYDPSQLTTTQQAYTVSMPLGKTIESILDYMDRAQHPGQVELATAASSSSEMESSSSSFLDDHILYAGGKIMTFLASCPTDLRGDDWRPLTRKALPTTTVGYGGFGGAVQRTPAAMNDGVAAAGKTNGIHSKRTTGKSSFGFDEEAGYATSSTAGDDDDEEEDLDTDMTPSSLLEYYRAPEHVEAYFTELGTQCAESALGVDIFVMVQPQDDDAFAVENSAELDVGLPFLRGLADRSGAPGPLVFPVHQGYATPIASNPDIQRLKREVCARVPWGAYGGDETESDDKQSAGHHPMAFGGELRLRLSPSFEVDKSPVDEVDEGPQLAPLYSSGGIMGPACEEEDIGNLWRLGTCDPFTSLSVDLDMKDKEAKDKLKVDGMGEVNWKPVMQTCFAYTTVVKDPEQPGSYLTVRQMRIACVRAPLTDDVETLYSSLDPEVVGSVLFHKLTLTLLRDGLSMAQTIGEDWLKSLLVCAYQSAETEEEIQREQAEKGLPAKYDPNNNNTTLTFYANERLLDREGELPAEDVLLGQGHERLKTLPLIVYSLLHCDAIRPSTEAKSNAVISYLPTMDARCAAGAQMSAMTPPTLAKCIAPKLQLWSAGGGMILDMIDLKMDSIIQSVGEFGFEAKTGKPRDDLVLFLDAPDCILVCDAGYVTSGPATKQTKTVVGPLLESAVNAAVRSYRTPPTVIYDFDDPGSQQDPLHKRPGYIRLLASLVEDQPGNDGASNFKEWGENLAAEIHEELEKEED